MLATFLTKVSIIDNQVKQQVRQGLIHRFSVTKQEVSSIIDSATRLFESEGNRSLSKAMEKERQKVAQPNLGDFGCIEPTDDDCFELPDDIATNLLIENASCNFGHMQIENLIFDCAVVHSETEMR